MRLKKRCRGGIFELVCAYLWFARTDISSGCFPGSPETFAVRARRRCMDAVSEVLKDVKLQGAMFYNGEFFSPWSVRAPESSTYAAYLCPGAEHVIIFHLVLEGQASAMINNEKVSLAAGDIVIFPHGDPHILQN